MPVRSRNKSDRSVWRAWFSLRLGRRFLFGLYVGEQQLQPLAKWALCIRPCIPGTAALERPKKKTYLEFELVRECETDSVIVLLVLVPVENGLDHMELTETTVDVFFHPQPFENGSTTHYASLTGHDVLCLLFNLLDCLQDPALKRRCGDFLLKSDSPTRTKIELAPGIMCLSESAVQKTGSGTIIVLKPSTSTSTPTHAHSPSHALLTSANIMTIRIPGGATTRGIKARPPQREQRAEWGQRHGSPGSMPLSVCAVGGMAWPAIGFAGADRVDSLPKGGANGREEMNGVRDRERNGTRDGSPLSISISVSVLAERWTTRVQLGERGVDRCRDTVAWCWDTFALQLHAEAAEPTRKRERHELGTDGQCENSDVALAFSAIEGSLRDLARLLDLIDDGHPQSEPFLPALYICVNPSKSLVQKNYSQYWAPSSSTPVGLRSHCLVTLRKQLLTAAGYPHLPQALRHGLLRGLVLMYAAIRPDPNLDPLRTFLTRRITPSWFSRRQPFIESRT
ncbi:hypothetical protein B0H14DRAFT_2565018 [Mycena olivaceomarginata]|nr:hypothetical protein B0H14DRAFT_2565018 [Mycena olivaceomarginata]